jgi:predicted esterase
VCIINTLTALRMLNSGLYAEPDANITAVVDTPKDPAIGLSPDGNYLGFWERPPLKSIKEVAEKEIKVAGLRLSQYFTASLARTAFYTGVSIQKLPSIEEPLAEAMKVSPEKMDLEERMKPVPLQVSSPGQNGENAENSTPAKPMIGYKAWNKSGDMICFCRLYTPTDRSENVGLQLYLANPKTMLVHGPLDIGDGLPLNATLASPVRWVNDRQLLCTVATKANLPFPVENSIPKGPETEEHSTSTKKKVRTYQDLIQTKYDEDLFHYMGTSHLVLVTIDFKEGKLKYKKKRVTESGLYGGASVSPNGRFIKIKQYSSTSRMVPYYRFGMKTDIYEVENGGDLRFIKTMSDLPAAENIPVSHNSCREGKRFSFWSEGHGALLMSVEALDGGDASNTKSKYRDLISCASEKDNFEAQHDLLRTELRWGGLDMMECGTRGILTESWWRTKKRRKWLCKFEEQEDGKMVSVHEELIVDGSYEDRYNATGSLMYTRSKYGTHVPITIGTEDSTTFVLSNRTGATSKGNIPYVDLYHVEGPDSNKSKGIKQKSIIKKGVTRRIWTSDHNGEKYQKVHVLLPSKPGCSVHGGGSTIRAIVSSETSSMPLNFYLCDLSLDYRYSNVGLPNVGVFPLTFRKHPYPSLKGYSKDIIRYCRRGDGIELNGTLYLPSGYDKTDPKRKLLPLLIWAYPREFKSANAASQVRDSPFRFSGIYPTSPLLWLIHGFAVLEGPAMPIVSQSDDARGANDTYVTQLVNSAAAAVDHVCQTLEVCDRRKVAVGGHSYGAFMTANLLAHTDGMFACGIARSGAYNRTLTPFGFQAEERTLWEAPSVYSKMSPFMNVSPSMSPILLIHGSEDENSGTYPQQSKRMFSALRGHGVMSRLVMLPKEGHGYRARESILHTLAETENWLRKHCLKRDNGEVTLIPRGEQPEDFALVRNRKTTMKILAAAVGLWAIKATLNSSA